MVSDDYKVALWAWFLRRARWHDDYSWQDIPDKVRNHLKLCGLDIERSGTPQVGTVSEYRSTFDENDELEAVVTNGWICNCGKYGHGGPGLAQGSGPWGDFKVEVNLGIPGPYPEVQIIYEVIEEAGSRGPE